MVALVIVTALVLAFVLLPVVGFSAWSFYSSSKQMVALLKVFVLKATISWESIPLGVVIYIILQQ